MSAHEENMVRITDVEERVVHWVLAASCLFCIITGVGLMFHSWSFIPTLLGGHYAAKLMHIYSGLIFGGMLVYSYYLWKKDCEFEQPDLQWVLKAGGYLWPVKDLPPVYKYNAGQKAFFWCLIACGIVIVVTGLFMWLWNPAAVPVVLAAFIMIHIYLGTAGNPGTVSAMITGYVSKAWCQTHCPRWYADRGKKDDETKIA